MSARSRERSRELAGYLKKMKVERHTGVCPMHCGGTFKINGMGILDHLMTCQGKRRRTR